MASFTQKIREQNTSLIITIPSPTVELLNLKSKQMVEVKINVIKKPEKK